MYFNLHTHRSVNDAEVLELVNQYPDEFDESAKYYSIGIHPWRISLERLQSELTFIESKLARENCLALGECGLDKRIEMPLETQMHVFEKQLELAEKFQKPVVLHCVAAYQEVIDAKNRLKISVPMIIHGFSKNEQVAKQLLDNGFYLSFGKYLLRNPELESVFKLVPDDRFFLETDMIDETIRDVYELAAIYRNISMRQLQQTMNTNFETVFGPGRTRTIEQSNNLKSKMAEWTERAELLFTTEGLNKLKNANVLVVGMGGVGSFAAEFIARAAVGKMTIVDGDVVDITNINRQLPALHSTIGMAKVDIVGDRLMDINPDLNLTRLKEFLSPERAYELVTNDFDYVVDCIDSITPKLNLIKSARDKKIKVVSSMGAGGKMDASKVKVSDISKTHNCHLATAVRKRLRKMHVQKGVKAVFSTEIQNDKSLKMTDGQNFKKSFYGTSSYMPGLFGLYCAETVIRYLLKK